MKYIQLLWYIGNKLITICKICPSASVGLDSPTLLATSDKLNVKKVFVNLCIFFLYSTEDTCFTRPKLWSLVKACKT